MGKSCAGKIALVSGASRGIGTAIAQRLAAEGAYVIVAARSLDSKPDHLEGTLQETLELVKAAGSDGMAVQVDLSSAESRAEMVAKVKKDVGDIDILVNNAAAAFYMPFEKFSASRFRVANAINFEAPWDLCQQFLPGMRAKKHGWILNLTSYAGDIPAGKPPFDDYVQHGGALLYGTTKAALNRFTVGLAGELYADNIVVNALAPYQMVITPGVRAMGIDENVSGIVVEPEEAMAEAALILCTAGINEHNGRIAKSLPLLRELGRPILSLDGRNSIAFPEM